MSTTADRREGAQGAQGETTVGRRAEGERPKYGRPESDRREAGGATSGW